MSHVPRPLRLALRNVIVFVSLCDLSSRFLFPGPSSPQRQCAKHREKCSLFLSGHRVHDCVSHRLPTSTLPLFDRLGRSTCDGLLSILTGNGFCNSRIPLCTHTPGESNIILGSDWVFAIGTTFCNGGSGILNPSQSVVASLPEGHHWSPDGGETTLYHGVAPNNLL